MTSNELRSAFNETYGLGEWPKSVIVDHETYANVCQDVFNYKIEGDNTKLYAEIDLGPNNGIMFKNVELILVR